MSNTTDLFPIERNRYFYGKLLTVRDFELEQQYLRKKSQLANRLSKGPGLVCGLGVTKSDESTLVIESGMAIDYQGRMVVLPETAIRKLSMIEGNETLIGSESAYLCLEYEEEDIEPVNAAGAKGDESRQFNVTREGARIFLTAQPPEYKSLMEAQGTENSSVLYSSDELTLVFSIPQVVSGGESITAKVLVVKNEKTPPVHFTLTGESPYIESEDGRVVLEFKEDSSSKDYVYTVQFALKARNISDTKGALFPKGAEIDLEVGKHNYKNYLDIDTRCVLCQDAKSAAEWEETTDSLEAHLRGADIPLYLAKIELINSAGSVFISSIKNLPFEQRSGKNVTNSVGGVLSNVTTSVRSLEYWQKPDVKASVGGGGKSLHLDFGLPAPERYDYVVSHGTVDLSAASGFKVNSRVFSEEIEHGLGAGTVDIRLSIEFHDRSTGKETLLYFGNSEIFKGKNAPAAPPWVEASAMVYPERGTMRIGLWFHDTVDGNRITVHYFAQKPERDTDTILRKMKANICVTPEFSHVGVRGTLQFEAEVTGSDDRRVKWSIKEAEGGSIDSNGLYRAPETAGTYEVTAVSLADEDVSTSAFVIVE